MLRVLPVVILTWEQEALAGTVVTWVKDTMLVVEVVPVRLEMSLTVNSCLDRTQVLVTQ